MIEIRDVRKSYKSFELNCSMNVLPGCITGLVGANGAGKSTTFKSILGLLAPDSGEIRIFGKDISELTIAEKEKLGVVMTDSGFSEYMTVKDIVPILNAMYHAFDKNKFLEKCERFQIPLNKKLKEFSTGMRAKVKILVAISHEANLLILDEPTAGLDVIARDELLELLRDYMNNERAILISSHISSDLEGFCDDIYIIHGGKIVLHEATDALTDEYGILKLDEKQYATIERKHLLYMKKEAYGYCCLTKEKQFYAENYPDIVMEKGSIDDVLIMMERGERL